ncbi:hypothetical protein AVEN_223491-1, partial [Araneus ventricosus]
MGKDESHCESLIVFIFKDAYAACEPFQETIFTMCHPRTMGKEESHREPLIVACQSSMEDAGSLKALWNTDCALPHNEKEYRLSFHMFNLLSRQGETDDARDFVVNLRMLYSVAAKGNGSIDALGK